MKHLLNILAFLTVATIAFAEKPEADAVASAKEWLLLVDSERYGQSWSSASDYFKSRVGKQQWESAVQLVRQPLGKTESRIPLHATYTEELPDAPDGAYWVIQFITNFQEKHYAVETITQMQQPDGKWKTAGYFIR